MDAAWPSDPKAARAVRCAAEDGVPLPTGEYQAGREGRAVSRCDSPGPGPPSSRCHLGAPGPASRRGAQLLAPQRLGLWASTALLCAQTVPCGF